MAFDLETRSVFVMWTEHSWICEFILHTKDISPQRSLASCPELSMQMQNENDVERCSRQFWSRKDTWSQDCKKVFERFIFDLNFISMELARHIARHIARLIARYVDTSRPGFLSPSAGLKFADIPNGLAAVSKVPVAGWAQIAAYFGFVEFSGGFDDYKTGTPGDYGFKVLTSSDPEEKTKKLSAELANGRLAMMAIIGMFFQDFMQMMHQSFWINDANAKTFIQKLY